MQVTGFDSSICFHCGEDLPKVGIEYLELDSKRQAFCCSGCKAVAEYIVDAGLDNYYKHRKNLPEKIGDNGILGSDDWNTFNDAALYANTDAGYAEAFIDIEGMHCVSCAWLVQSQLERDDVQLLALDHQTGIAKIRWEPEHVSLGNILYKINSLGYLPHVIDSDKDLINELTSKHSENSLKRLVIAGLGMMQVMMFAVALYTGDEQNMQNVYRRFLIWVSMLVTFPVLFYSGMPFLKHAWQSLKLKRLHMDIPIAIALLSAFSLSVISSFTDSGEVYFDSVVMFVFFLSISRFIQENISRRMLNSRQAFARMLPVFVETQVQGKRVKKPVSQIQSGEQIAVPIGAVIPVDGTILEGDSELDTSSLSGESQALLHTQGDQVFAGMRNLSRPLSIQASSDVKHSTLSILSQRLRASSYSSTESNNRITLYVSLFISLTLCLAISLFFYWFNVGLWQHGFEIALAVLVVSCPCALAIALPSSLASLTKHLHDRGIYVIAPNKLLKLFQLSAVIFDKTGTLTDPNNCLQSHTQENLRQKYLHYAQALAVYTQHPKARFLQASSNDIEVNDVQEIQGQGVCGLIKGERYYLGKATFSAQTTEDANDTSGLAFGNGQDLLLTWHSQEVLRKGTSALVNKLKELGLKLFISSGDSSKAVNRVANKLDIRNYASEQSSTDKLKFLHALQHQKHTVVCVGDGINDAEFLQQADLSISFTDATELAQAQADVLIAGNDLGKFSYLLESLHKLKRIYRQNLAWAVIYNVIMLPLAVLGFIQPWIAALGMSLSSLFVVLNSLRLNREVKQNNKHALQEVLVS